MKKLTLLASLVVTIAMMAQNRTMFVHHNGDIDLFFFAEIDSIRYSSIDVDSSQWCDMPIVQEIWTADSVYRYRMEEIDSVTFQSPKNIPLESSIDLAGEIAPYVLGVEYGEYSAILHLASNTPESLIPEYGSGLYQFEASEALPDGFAAKAEWSYSTDEGIDVYCESAEFDEIFEQLSWVGGGEIPLEPESDDASNTRAIKSDGDAYVYSTTLRYPDLLSGAVEMTDELRDIPAGPEDPRITGKISIAPDMVKAYSGAYIIKTLNGEKKKVSRLTSVLESNVRANVSGRHDIGDAIRTVSSRRKISRNLSFGLGQTFNVNITGNMKLNGKMGLDFAHEAGYRASITTQVTYDNNGNALSESNGSLKIKANESNKLSASFYGSLTITESFAVTMVQTGDSLKSISNVFTYGSKLDGTALFLTSDAEKAATDNSLYQRITATGVKVTPIASLTGSAKYGSATHKLSTLAYKPKQKAYYAVPVYSFANYDANSGEITYNMTGTPMEFASSNSGAATTKDGSHTFYGTSNYWPAANSFTVKVNYTEGYGNRIYPTATLPGGQRILAAPAYPSVCDMIFPTCAVLESQGIHLTIGAPIIGTAKNGTTVVNVGNIFPVKE